MSVDVKRNGRSAFEGTFPEPLRGVVHHAERFSVALALIEMDESRELATGPRELLLSETWIIGRASEIAAFVDDVTRDWRSGALPVKSAAIAIESYLVDLHRRMANETELGAPTCCVSHSSSATLDFLAAREQGALRYPPTRLSVAPPPLVFATLASVTK